MVKLWLLVLTTLFTPKPQTLTVKQTTSILKVSVLIRAKEYRHDKKGKLQMGMIGCSGTYISPSVVLTAAHCFEYPATDIWVRDNNGLSLRVWVMKIDPTLDLALLAAPGLKPHAFAKVAKSVRVGEGVYNVGSPQFFEFMVSEGVVGALNFVANPFLGRYTVTTAFIDHGSSGGGAFNEKGELIGVNTLMTGIFGWAGVSLAVDHTTIAKFLK
jgi:serine protease Do